MTGAALSGAVRPVPASGVLVAAGLVGAAALWAPAAVLCVLGAAGAVALAPRAVRAPLAVVAGLKVVLALVATLAAGVLFADGLLPGQPDQVFYVETAHGLALRALTERALVFDFESVVELHNRSYNVLLGWATSSNPFGGLARTAEGASLANLLSYRLLNALFATLLVVVAVRLADAVYAGSPRLPAYRTLTVWGVGLMPYLTIYSQMVTRDVMIALLFAAFVYGLVGRRLLLAAAATVAMFYTRLQFALAFGVGAVVWGLVVVAVRRRRSPFGAVVALGAAAATGYAATYALPELSFARSALEGGRLLDFAIAFPISVVGLDLLFAPDEALGASRAALLALRAIVPESVLLPVLAVAVAAGRRQFFETRAQVRLYLLTLSVLVMYCLGYFVVYGVLFIRLMSPFYPVMLVLVLPLAVRLVPGRPAEVAPPGS